MSHVKSSLIRAGAKVHFIGVGGIGMSGLAHMLADQGCIVSGSDRGVDQPENKRIFDALRAQGIKLFPQDGSYISERPDALVYSTAIEDDNPDFVVANGTVDKVHRSQALDTAINNCGKEIIAVTGSCGKTTVSAWLAESLCNAGIDTSFLSGGLVNRFRSESVAGNFKAGSSNYFVFEADESDKSLLNYSPDYSLVLNIGTDHYPKEELVEVFEQFLRQTKKGAVISREVQQMLNPECMKHLEVSVFDTQASDIESRSEWQLLDYSVKDNQAQTTIRKADHEEEILTLPAPGIHTAANALAIYATISLLGESIRDLAGAVCDFHGVWRRFDYHGTLCGANVYDDYAHNVEKIISSMNAAREITPGGVTVLFQPHGYGPLGFMRDELFKELEKSLSANDTFALMPVFYAGGTTSFKPQSDEVIEGYCSRGDKKYIYFESRAVAELYLNENITGHDTVIVMGARDNSLSDWAAQICN